MALCIYIFTVYTIRHIVYYLTYNKRQFPRSMKQRAPFIQSMVSPHEFVELRHFDVSPLLPISVVQFRHPNGMKLIKYISFAQLWATCLGVFRLSHYNAVRQYGLNQNTALILSY